MMKFRMRKIFISVILIPGLLLSGCAEQGVIAGFGAEEVQTVQVWEAIPEEDPAEEAEEISESDESAEEAGASEEEDDADEEGSETSDTAEDADSSEEAQEAGTQTVTEETDIGSMTGSEELIALVTSFMQEWGLSSSNFSVAFTNLSTGEIFYYNEDKLWDGCSTYKLPLNMLYYDMEAAGEIGSDDIIPGTGGYTLAECHHQSLQYSNNELSEAMVDNLGNYVTMKRSMLKYYTQTEAEIDSDYFNHNYYSARMMMDCCSYVYQHSTEYAELLGYLEAAQPGEYFKTYLSDCTIAQKYGLRDGYTHTAGIFFTDTPFVLSVYSYNAGGSSMIGSLAVLFYEYVTGA